MKFYHILPLVIIQSYALSAVGQVKDSIGTQHIQEVEVSAKLHPSITLSSNPVQTFSGSTIDKVGILSVADAVRRFSGVVVKDFGGIGGMKTIAVRGVGSEHTAVLYDGMAVSNAQSGQIDIGKFSLDNVEMISLTIGQSDDIFRTARSLGAVGVLDIQTSTPQFKQKDYSAKVQLRAGSWGQFNPYVYYAHKLGNKFTLSLDGSWQRADGRYRFEMDNISEKYKGKRNNTDVDIKRTELNLFGNLTEKQKLSFKLYYFDSERGLPGGVVIYSDQKNGERLWDKDFFTQAKYLNYLNDKFDLQVQTKYTHTWTKYIDKNPKQPNGELMNKYIQNELYVTGTLLYNLSKNISFSLAEDISYGHLSANLPKFAYPDRYTSLSALSGKYQDDRLTVVGKLLGTYVSEDVENGSAASDKKRLSPSVSLSYKLLDETNLRVRASYKDIFRVPSFNDLYYTNSGNSSLKPEKTKQYNIGLTWSESFSDLFSFLSVTTDFYHNTVKDKIIIYPSSFNPKSVNLGKVIIDGFDINVNTRMDFNTKVNIQLSGSYTYQHAIDKTNAEDKNYKDQIPYTPRHSGAGSASLENPFLNISYSIVLSGKTYSLPQNIDSNKISPYLDQTISVNKSFNIGMVSMRAQADISNLANKIYYIMDGYPMPGRAYRFTLRMNF